MIYPAFCSAGTVLPLLVLPGVFPGWGIAPALRAVGWSGQQIVATLASAALIIVGISSTLVHWLL